MFTIGLGHSGPIAFYGEGKMATKEIIESRMSSLRIQKMTLENQLRSVQEESIRRVAQLQANIQATQGAIQLCAELLEEGQPEAEAGQKDVNQPD